MSESWAPAAKASFWADAHAVTEAVLAEAQRKAYLVTGGSDGCATCKALTNFADKVQHGHLDCALRWAMGNGAHQAVANLRDGGLLIEVSRVLEDPRFGEWMNAE